MPAKEPDSTLHDTSSRRHHTAFRIISLARSDWTGGKAVLKLVTALPCREYRSDSIQCSSIDLDQPFAVACCAYHSRASRMLSLNRRAMLCPHGIPATAGGGDLEPDGGAKTCADFLSRDFGTGCAEFAGAGAYARKKALILEMLLAEKPSRLGNALFKSLASLSITPAPQPSLCCLRTMSLPTSGDDLAALELARFCLSFPMSVYRVRRAHEL